MPIKVGTYKNINHVKDYLIKSPSGKKRTYLAESFPKAILLALIQDEYSYPASYYYKLNPVRKNG